MSRASLPSSPPHRGGNFRPRLEALEDRNAPGVLPGTAGLPLLDDPWGLAAQKREAAEVADAASSSAATRTTSPVVEFFHPDVVRGESTLTRTDEGVTAHLSASGLAPGVYTLWMKVDDPAVGHPIAGWLAGHVVGQGGNLNFAAHLSVGEVLERNPDFPSGPLQDARNSTITLVVRSHGPADPGRIYEQTHTFEAGVAVNYLRSTHVPPP